MGDRAELRSYRVSGQVQGVGFRWWTQRVGAELALVGRVRNESDGTVSVRVAGSPEALDRLEEALRHGPAGARVESVREEELGRQAGNLGGAPWSDFAIER